MKKITTLIFILLSASTYAILPPFYHTSAQYRALLDDPTLIGILGSGQAIKSITLKDGNFIVETPSYELQVDIIYKKQDRPGPAKYHFEFHQPIQK